MEADNIAYRFPFKVSLFIFANVLIKYRLSTFLRLFSLEQNQFQAKVRGKLLSDKVLPLFM
ncbi:hypothetical protein HMPREF0648_0400 [Prevotella bivia JCVIHMP010]|nr:hypothetical protein HMPREF0648_0400 [Prevotella bivia JCVIHMP010]